MSVSTDFNISGLDFLSPAVTIWPTSDRGRDKFTDWFGDGAVSVEIRKSCVDGILFKIKSVGLSYSEVSR